jgi:hypothetical protein
LPGRIVLASIALAGMLTTSTPITLASIALTSHLLSGNCQIIDLKLLVFAVGGETLGMLASIMRGR